VPTTRAFKSGNSQAVRIPAEIAYQDMSQELTITRNGDVITIHPKRSGLKRALEDLLAMPVPSTVEPLERIQMPERDRY
jgi:antitoxin VapB